MILLNEFCRACAISVIRTHRNEEIWREREKKKDIEHRQTNRQTNIYRHRDNKRQRQTCRQMKTEFK